MPNYKLSTTLKGETINYTQHCNSESKQHVRLEEAGGGGGHLFPGVPLLALLRHGH